jgi:hypothetical protein
MYDLSLIENYYKKFIKDVNYWIPEGIYNINLELMHHFDLLHFQPFQEKKDPIITRYFQIIESSEKITLVNDEFVVWIIPDKIDQFSLTYTFIALTELSNQKIQLEVGFVASGVYNTSKLILNVLEKFLAEIQETQQTLSKFEESA